MQILKIKSIINEPEKGNNAKVTFVFPMLETTMYVILRTGTI
jgi:hypothetical protein